VVRNIHERVTSNNKWREDEVISKAKQAKNKQLPWTYLEGTIEIHFKNLRLQLQFEKLFVHGLKLFDINTIVMVVISIYIDIYIYVLCNSNEEEEDEDE
jgi:hypothetical protein